MVVHDLTVEPSATHSGLNTCKQTLVGSAFHDKCDFNIPSSCIGFMVTDEWLPLCFLYNHQNSSENMVDSTKVLGVVDVCA